MYLDILLSHQDIFDTLETFFEGNSRIIKYTDHPDLLISKLKPSVFSIKINNIVFMNEIDEIRCCINALLSEYLHKCGIATSTLCTHGDYILLKKETVAPIEVIVKGAMVGSPKHIYKEITETKTRFGNYLQAGHSHKPYVRFDWRNALPDTDQCMPVELANYFIDAREAEKTALGAFVKLNQLLHSVDLNLVDICFFMNEEGNVICGEISTDNTRIEYTGSDSMVRELFSSSEVIKKARAVLQRIKAAGK